MKATITWDGEARFTGHTESGHDVVMDGPPDFGGKNAGPRPMEMMLLGLGGCSAFDVVLILQRGRQEIHDCRVEIDAERAKSDPKVYTRVHLHYVLRGNDLEESKVARAIQLSFEKYCSASAMFQKTAAMTHDYEILEAADA